MLGQQVRNARSNGSMMLDMHSLASGMYTVRVSDGRKSSVQRVALN